VEHRQLNILVRIENKLDALIKRGVIMSATLDDIIQATSDEKTVLDSFTTFVEGLQSQINSANGNQTKIDTIFANIQANKAEAAAALLINTPAAPAAPAAPATPAA
jgi:hypothetical protein